MDQDQQNPGLDDLQPGPKGFQTEAGFEIVRGDPDYPDGYAAIVVPLVLCRSSKHPTPQLRFVSPYEVSRGRLEVADHMACARIHGVPVIGRTDDLAAVAVQQARASIFSLAARAIAKVVTHALDLPEMIEAAWKRVTRG